MFTFIRDKDFYMSKIPQTKYPSGLPLNLYMDCMLIGKVICLDPGHGGNDRSNKGFSGKYIEADGVLDIALNLERALADLGATVVLTRNEDTTLSIPQRCAIAEDTRADIFISIHTDACQRPAVKGATAYYSLHPLFESRRLAIAVMKSYCAISGETSRGTLFRWNSYNTDDYYGVLRGTSMPAIILECGFHTNETTEARLLMPEYRKIAAQGIKMGIIRYFKDL